MADSGVRIDGNTVKLPGGAAVRFVRTLRLPEKGTHPLPPGLGEFPVRRITDYPDTAPEQWLARGGIMLPVYLREAMWLSFAGTHEPAALQVGVGKVCAVSGKPWSDSLSQDPQNYVVLPRQPWLDGINSGKGTVRQFVAVPLGLGATVEGQVTGEETWGGVQLQSFTLTEPKRALWKEAQRLLRMKGEGYRGGHPGMSAGVHSAPEGFGPAGGPGAPGGFGPAGGPGAPGGYGAALSAAAPASAMPSRAARPAAMGLGVGGSMRQEVYQDDRALEDWSPTPAGRVFVHLVTPPDWQRITGELPPPTPVDRAAYTSAGLPWFDYYDEGAQDLSPTDPLSGVRPVGDWIGADHEPWQPPTPDQVTPLKDAKGKVVEDGEW